jgi:large-conductance mechanosensitive channel
LNFFPIQKRQEKSLLGERELRRYREFALREDMFKVAVAIMLGNSFNKVVYGVSDYLFMPVFTFFLSKTGDHWRSWALSPLPGLEFEVGRLLGVVVDFLATSTLLYILYVRLIGEAMKKEEPKGETKKCMHCFSPVHPLAEKCPYCTGGLIVETRRSGRKDKGTEIDRGQ